MLGIELSKEQHGFLKLGLSTNEVHAYSGELMTYMVTNSGILFTTNGYCMYMIRVAESTQSGYYLWSEGMKKLLKIDGKSVQSTRNLIDGAMQVRQKTIDTLMYNDPTPITSFNLGNPQDGLNIEILPNKAKIGVGFRKGSYKGVMNTLCLGQNYSSFNWGLDGEEIAPAPKGSIVVLDAKLLIAVAKCLKPKTMTWRDGFSSVIFGDIEGDHAIVMPLLMGGVK